MPATPKLESILADAPLAAEIAAKLDRLATARPAATAVPPPGAMAGFGGPPSAAAGAPKAAGGAADRIRARAANVPGTEAIVRRFGRPTLLVRNGTFEVPPSDIWTQRLYAAKSRLDRTIASVGRVELANHPAPWAGTGWLIAPRVAVTNRHVALLFAGMKNGDFSFRRSPAGGTYGASLDFKEEHLQPDVLSVKVKRIVYVADLTDDAPDLAFLELESEVELPSPLTLAAANAKAGDFVATIGYPAFDDRNNLDDMGRIFQGIYEVKRLAPGFVLGSSDEGWFNHDCTTLGGSSGSAVVDLETGYVVGLHFAGEYLDRNYAVSASKLREYVTRFIGADALARPHAAISGGVPSPQVPATAAPPPTAANEAPPTASDLADRTGYDRHFLGTTDALDVPMPALSDRLLEKVAKIESGPRVGEHVLRYTHYSVVMNAERRMAFYTATNIDGQSLQRIKRKKDAWFYDPRISSEAQIGEDLYVGNDLDRGHLTRRLDPAWGDQAARAEKDTFFFTNCTPQHSGFNQRIWLGLEDYILDSAETDGFKATIFTGPVFGRGDPPYRSAQLPKAYWKVAAVRHRRRGLSATGYIVSQADLISHIEFVFGQYETYQAPVARIAAKTGLDFGALVDADPLGRTEAAPVRRLGELDDIVL